MSYDTEASELVQYSFILQEPHTPVYRGIEAVEQSDEELTFWSEANLGSNPGATIFFSSVISGKQYLLQS